MKNIIFFQTALVVYLFSAAGYIAYILKPEKKRLALFGLIAAATGFVLHALYFWFRWSEGGRIPISSYFEAVNALGMGIVLVFLVMEVRYKIAALGPFMLPLVVLLMLPAALASGRIEELDPVLQSAWLGVHTTLAILADAAFAFAFIVSIMYLIQERQLKSKHLGAIFHRLPSLDIMDTLGYKAISFGWPLYTLGMVTGSLWAKSAWGDYWSWDPKEAWSLIVWVVYLALLHLRTIGWRGRKMAWLGIIGFAFVLFSFFVVSRSGAGKHVF